MPKARIDTYIEYEPGKMEKILEERLKKYGIHLTTASIDPFTEYKNQKNDFFIKIDYNREAIKDWKNKKIDYSRNLYFNPLEFYSHFDIKEGKLKWNPPRQKEYLIFSTIYPPGKDNIKYIEIDNPIRLNKKEFGIFGEKKIFANIFNKYYNNKIFSKDTIKVNDTLTNRYSKICWQYDTNFIENEAKKMGVLKESERLELDDYINMLVDYFCK